MHNRYGVVATSNRARRANADVAAIWNALRRVWLPHLIHQAQYGKQSGRNSFTLCVACGRLGAQGYVDFGHRKHIHSRGLIRKCNKLVSPYNYQAAPCKAFYAPFVNDLLIPPFSTYTCSCRAGHPLIDTKLTSDQHTRNTHCLPHRSMQNFVTALSASQSSSSVGIVYSNFPRTLHNALQLHSRSHTTIGSRKLRVPSAPLYTSLIPPDQ
ncbi:uncharacterized protein B0I36DRAFT_17411 [Microdochium trichocladiopsis]|uniref:Uncharacterized protein n=1 Tax=Microdochium trichocladiopsis TaxID=1682393 RepID=A0A9P9BWN1_9PEZI|nr:uncharacterized protein B0I36DRAFT_17411 [Microdochium trichocladiopsis]KAH7040962.1 hypothetical protein B0I36DRAFT_17411 [Microdochium trichocladiopsis]